MAERTCEVLVIDSRAILRYRGAIDDQYGLGTRKPSATKNPLKDAIEEVLEGKPVTVATTPVVGCLLDRLEPKTASKKNNGPRVRPAAAEIVSARKEKDGAAPDVGKVTYAGDVAAIVRDR